MAKNSEPIAKRCKALGISPAVMGYTNKDTFRNSYTKNRRKKSCLLYTSPSPRDRG